MLTGHKPKINHSLLRTKFNPQNKTIYEIFASNN